ncbi:MAG TPA: DUF1587 domain-containing protein, partial [Pseudomonadales bacterium]
MRSTPVPVFRFASRLAGAVALAGFLAGGAHAQDEAFTQLVGDYCMDCHNSEDWAGSLAMDTLDLDHLSTNADVWENAITKLRGRLMPPAGQEQPDQELIDAAIAHLESTIDADAEAAREQRHVGHVPIQRLNRTEFAASVKELLDVEIDPTQFLPSDIEVEGFDNIAGALGISPSFLEQYISAARK